MNNTKHFMYPELLAEDSNETTRAMDEHCLIVALDESDYVTTSVMHWIDESIALGTDQLWDAVY